jgi:1-acyl-sn-glycerol-3-phosphate acyltransferase
MDKTTLVRRRSKKPAGRYDDFGQTARVLAESARERSVELGQTARDTVAELDIRWAHGRLANGVRETTGRFLIEPLMNAYTRRRVEGTENLRGLKGPIVFVANHASHMDTPAILRALPRRWRKRVVVAAAADYFYRRKAVAVAVSVLFNTVPIERRPGFATARAMSHIDRLLDRGDSLLLFPEGTRNRTDTVGRLRFGAAKIASRHDALIVPIYVDGTSAAMPPGYRWLRRRHRGLDPRRHLVTISIGAPIKPSGDNAKSVAAATTERIALSFEQARLRTRSLASRAPAARARARRRH